MEPQGSMKNNSSECEYDCDYENGCEFDRESNSSQLSFNEYKLQIGDYNFIPQALSHWPPICYPQTPHFTNYTALLWQSLSIYSPNANDPSIQYEHNLIEEEPHKYFTKRIFEDTKNTHRKIPQYKMPLPQVSRLTPILRQLLLTIKYMKREMKQDYPSVDEDITNWLVDRSLLKSIGTSYSKNMLNSEENYSESEILSPNMVGEQEFYLPISNIGRIMRGAIPRKGKVSKEAKLFIQECTTEYISFIASEASDRCFENKRKTISSLDVTFSLEKLSFNEHSKILKQFVKKYTYIGKFET